ncbi:MAG TPA: SHOCT domain-containing protein [Verrucomicrobiae bacterium]|nr:SHOCT domain-containing protein [Verrucomicrobiae bacterium]
MKKLIVPILVGFSAMTLLTGCIGLSIGGGTTTKPVTATVGQQLVDLQKAKDSGAITEAEYQDQKSKLLNGK